MEPSSELLAKKADQAFTQLSHRVFSFLDFASLMQALTVSQDFYHLLNKYFKSFLVINNLTPLTSLAVEEDHYLKLFRAFYHREVLIASFSDAKNSYKDLKFNRTASFARYGVKDFSMGTKFTVLHLYNNDIIFLKNEEYLNSTLSMETIISKNFRKNVAKFSTASNDLFYLTSSGQLHVIFNSNEKPSSELTEGVLAATVNKPIGNFSLSYPHAILIPKSLEVSYQEKAQLPNKEEHKDSGIPHGSDSYIQHLDMTNLTPEDLNTQARLKKVDGLDGQSILCFCVGASSAYFATDKNKTYECDLNKVTKDQKYLTSVFAPFKTRTIKSLWCGKGFFFALEQMEIKSIEKWNKEEVLEWAETQPFCMFVTKGRCENITGADLITADKDYLMFRFGIEEDDMAVKFLNEIEKVSKKTYTTPKVFGWGNNTFGQLGLNTGQTNVTQPTEIKTIPEFGKEECVVHMECGMKQTVITTNKGKVWITEIPPKKESKDKQFARWVDITPLCQTLKDGRQYQVVKVSLSKDHFAVLAANTGQKKVMKSRGNGKESGPVKLKGADHICNRLLWDKSMNKDEFVVGYEDRFLGILEIPFNEFCLKTDIPTHRIKYFKKSGEVVWDRATKMNNI